MAIYIYIGSSRGENLSKRNRPCFFSLKQFYVILLLFTSVVFPPYSLGVGREARKDFWRKKRETVRFELERQVRSSCEWWKDDTQGTKSTIDYRLFAN